MTVIVASDTPDSIRGTLKRWFIEPRPNVFVGSVNRKVRTNLIAYVRRNAPDLGLLVINSTDGTQGMEMVLYGDSKYSITEITGLQLVVDRAAK